MQYKKTVPQNVINLQSGMYAHLVDEHIVINDVNSVEPRHLVNKINRSFNIRKLRIIINVIATVGVLLASLFTGFYPLSLLIFVGLWDLRQIKRYKLPINSSNYIPFKNIKSVKVKKGVLGFNYLDVKIEDDNGKLSMKPIKLYDSESTLIHAVDLFKRNGLMNDTPAPEKIKLEGEEIIIDEASKYVEKEGKLFYTINGKYRENRVDAYQYVRAVSLMALIIGFIAIGVKIYTLFDGTRLTAADFVAILLLILLCLIPYKFLRKALPNVIKPSSILEVVEGKKYTLVKTKGLLIFPAFVKFKKDQIDNLKKFAQL